jgi:hypothetical protein
MQSLFKEEFGAARSALLDAATAVDARRLRDAEEHLRTLQAICEILLDLLMSVPSKGGSSKGDDSGKG